MVLKIRKTAFHLLPKEIHQTEKAKVLEIQSSNRLSASQYVRWAFAEQEVAKLLQNSLSKRSWGISDNPLKSPVEVGQILKTYGIGNL